MKKLKNKAISGSISIISRQIILILASLVFATIFLGLSGYEPFAVVNGIIRGVTSDVAGTIRWATPLILSGLAICVTYKAEVFNLGVDGQLYMGAAAATAIALQIPETMNPVMAITIVCLMAMLAGAAFAMIPALLKVYLDTNEVVSTLLLNFIAALFIEYLVSGPLIDKTEGTNLNASATLPENARLPRIQFLEPSSANVGFYIAIIVAVFVAFVFFKTTLGHEIKMVGSNPVLAKYAGMRPKKTILQVMGMSGAIAGLVGAIEVTAIQHRLLAGFNPGFGFDGIVVSLLGNNNPVGVIFSGLFFGALENGGINMGRTTNVPSAVTQIVMAIIIITISAKFVLPKVKTMKLGRNKKTITTGGGK
jgi:ABC-type uncharacterized transport system, permease component